MNLWGRIKRLLFGCEFRGSCKLYNPKAYTCNEGDQSLCGLYKDLKYGRVRKPHE